MKILKFKKEKVAEKKAKKLAKTHSLAQVGKWLVVFLKDK